MSSIYREAAIACRKMLENASISSSLGEGEETGSGDGSKSAQLALKAMVYKSAIQSLLQAANLNLKALKMDPMLAIVMLYDVLFGSGKISGGGEVKRKLSELLPALLAARDQLMAGKSSFAELLPESLAAAISLPLHLRVNTVLTNRAAAIQYLSTKFPGHHISGDELVNNLLVITPTIESIGADAWVVAGKLIPQDKASCFPAQVLANHLTAIGAFTGDIIDACAAPGNKTSHLSMLLFSPSPSPSRGRGRVFAFEQHVSRCLSLQRRMSLLLNDPDQQRVLIQNADFLSINGALDQQYQNVTGILLDPSCSGSGIVRGSTGLRRLIEKYVLAHYQEDNRRLRGLQAFQQRVLRHAMTAFPAALAVVYSTCSIHASENEHVVQHALDYSHSCNLGWRLHLPPGFDTWHRRGVKGGGIKLTEEQSAMLIRCLSEDGMNGFFVALFVRDVAVDAERCRELLLVGQKDDPSSTFGRKRKIADDDGTGNENDINDSQVHDSIEKKKKKKENEEMKQQGRKEKPSKPSSSFFGRATVSNRKLHRFGRK